MRFIVAIATSSLAMVLFAGCESRPAPAKVVVGDPKEMSHKGKALSAWIAQLDAGDKEARYEAVGALGAIEYGEAAEQRDRAITSLGQALRDKDSVMRYSASTSLQQFGKRALMAFTNALGDQNVEVRLHAAQSLGRIPEWSRGPRIDRDAFPIPPEPVVQALIGVLVNDKDPEVRRAAAVSLSELREYSVPQLLEVLKHRDTESKILVMEALRRASSDQHRKAVPILTDLVSDENDHLRREAARTLGELKDDAGEAVPALLAASKRSDESGREAVKALQQITKVPRSVTPALAPFVRDLEPEVSLKAIEYLSVLEEKDGECLGILFELIKRRDSAVRGRAATLLGRYGSAGKAAVPALIEIVRTDEDGDTVGAAAHTLGKIGPEAKAAIPALSALEKDYQKQLEELPERMRSILQSRLNVVRAAISKIGQ